ncbi:MAG TPA: glycosyltransferase family 4 protein [Terriglobales bacterium]|nr:glycosyltransferase family 4 protein [Terriglobales bacterium]
MGTQPNPPITIFTPSFADESNTNAQNLTVKEIVARLPPQLFRVIMISGGSPDDRIVHRPNTELVSWTNHGNTAKLINKIVMSRPDIYFFPRYGPLDALFYKVRQYLRLRTALVSYVVMTMTDAVASELATQSIRQADRVCTNSRYVAKTVSRQFGLDSEVVYDGVDQRFFFTAEPRDVSLPPVVLYAGSFQPRKRVELVIQQAIRWPNIRFRLAGSGETQQSCRRLTERHGCKNVTFLGHLTPHELAEEMRNAGIFLFPSVIEGHPQVLLQAAACGLPAIAMSCYQPEYVVNGETGFLVESDAELEERLELLIANAELRRLMSESAVRHSQKFDWTQIARQWGKIFLEVAGVRLRIPSTPPVIA